MVADLVGEGRSAVGRREWLTGLGRTGHAAEQLLLCPVQQRRHMVRPKSQLACDVVARKLLEHPEPHDALLHVGKLRHASHQPELFLGTGEQVGRAEVDCDAEVVTAQSPSAS